MRLSSDFGLESTINIKFHWTGTEKDLLDCSFSSGQCFINSILAGVTCGVTVMYIISTASSINTCMTTLQYATSYKVHCYDNITELWRLASYITASDITIGDLTSNMTHTYVACHQWYLM